MSDEKENIVWDNKGQYAHPGKITGIRSNRITMKGIKYSMLGIDNLGNKQMMHPDGVYYFPGATYVIEYPILNKEDEAKYKI